MNKISSSISLAGGHEAWCNTSQDGKTIVSVKSTSKPLKPRSVSVGAATLEFYWVYTGKTTYWHFTPTFLDSEDASYIENSEDNGQDQIIKVDLGSRMFPATGIIKTDVTGQITAPAVRFDLPHAADLWVFILRSPWLPLKIAVEKSQLNIAHSSAQATAQIESVTSDSSDEQSLRADVSVHGEGFKKVWLSLRRNVKRAWIEETLGELTGTMGRMETFTWKPAVRDFDVTLITYSEPGLGQFCDFLKSLSLDAHYSLFMGPMSSFISNDFLLSDGPNVDYTLQLTGEKHFIGHEKDETTITLTN